MSKKPTGYTHVIQQAFVGLDEKAVNLMRQFAVKASYGPNVALCNEGEREDTFYIVTKGRVVITRKVEGSDEDFVIGFLGPGGYFGEGALISEEPRGATVTTIVESEMLEFTKEQFDEVLLGSPAMARSILKTLTQALRETDKRAIEDLEARNAELAQAYAELEAAQADRVARAALEAQLDVAAKAQRSLLPTRLPNVENYQFAAQFAPARQIGGDFYDVRNMEDGRTTVLLADVSDKGAHAALFMAVARTLFMAEEEYLDDPVNIAMAVHEGLLSASTYDMFVTALYGILDPDKGVFRYVRAGHDEPLLVNADGTTTFLRGKGRFLGLWHDMPPVLEEQQLQLHSGDCLIIYSDGVTDMRDPDGVSFGRDQLASLVRSLRMYDADRIARSIYNVVQQHRGVAEAFDDFTLLVMRVE